MLEQFLDDIWVEGEVSNLKAYPSGHLYFTLKDAKAQLPGVCFRSVAQSLRFRLTDGMEVIVHGRLDLYAPSGRFQFIIDRVEPRGKGALQLAFEQLKARLEQEGLFAPERKRPLPGLPEVVGIVTSPVGAVIHDMLRTLRRHKVPVQVVLFPSAVQGEGAAVQIAEGIRALNARAGVDVIIVARGGGSLEDLWPFNEEVVARAIAASRIPIISAVGHEVDFTIADFVADKRAATPTAAAELIAQGWNEARRRVPELVEIMAEELQQAMLDREQTLESLVVKMHREVLGLKLRAFSCLRALTEQVERWARDCLVTAHRNWHQASVKLDALSPLASLKRGYAICRKSDGTVVSRVGQVSKQEALGVLVSDGTIECTVQDTASLARLGLKGGVASA